jgi:hypothetical protein
MTTAENLLSIIKSKQTVYLFREFLHELHNAENLSFWMEVEDLKMLGDSEVPTRVKEIYDKYFDAASQYELNVPGSLRKELVELVKTPSKSTFNAAQASVWKVMEHDSFPKFLQSDKLKNFKGCRYSHHPLTRSQENWAMQLKQKSRR